MVEAPKVAFPPGLVFTVGTFPKVSERFVFREIDCLSRGGVGGLVFCLRRGAHETPPGEEGCPPSVCVPKGFRLAAGASRAWCGRASLSVLARLGRAWKGEPGARSAWRLLRGALQGGWVAGCLEQLEAGDIHGHFMNHPSTVAWVASLFSDRKCSLSGHAWDVFVGPEFLGEKLGTCGPIVACNLAAAESLKSSSSRPEQVRLVHHGVPLERWPLRDKEPEGPPRLLWIGRFVEKKDPGLFLDLCEALHARDPERPWTAIMVGAGPLFALASEGTRDKRLEGRVSLAGEKTEGQVRDLVEDSHLLVVTSRRTPAGDMEGIPNVILEAGAVGVAVVATETGSVSEVVVHGRTGSLVPEGDLDALTEAVDSLMRNPERRRRLAEAMRKRVETDFDSERQTRTWADTVLGPSLARRGEKRSPRVAFVLEATEGGTARHVSSVLPALAERGLDVHLVCSVRRDPSFRRCISDLEQRGVPVWEVPMCREIRPWRDALSLVRLVRLFKAQRFELVHTHSSKAGLLGRLAAAACPVPWVLHSPHAYAFLGAKGRVSRKALVLAERSLARLCDGILAVGAEEAQETVKQGILAAKDVALAKNGLVPFPRRPKPSSRAIREELGLDPDKLTVGGVGRLSRQKSPMDFVEMAAKARRAFQRVQFVWLGEGPLRGALERRAEELGVRDCLRMPGHQANMDAWYPVIDLLCHTALWEGLPYVLLEAMSQGIPVLGYAVPGVREMIRDGHNGAVVPCRDVDALSRRVVELLQARETRITLGEAARKIVLEGYRLETQVDALLGAYEALVEGRRIGDGGVR